MIDFLLNFVFINYLTVKGQLWVTDEEVVSLIRRSSLRFVSVKFDLRISDTGLTRYLNVRLGVN